MYMPILDAEDGYGFTYGVRVAYPGLIGERSRLSAPLTWGGFKRAGVELDRTFVRGPFSRMEFGAAIQQQKNPAFEEKDDPRARLGPRRARAGRSPPGRHWRLAARVVRRSRRRRSARSGSRQPSTRGSIPCCRATPSTSPRRSNGCSSTAGRRSTGRASTRAAISASFGQNVVVLRAVREDASEPLPPYLKSLLGGWSSLRGFRAGSYVGDTMVTGSLELRMPLSSPLSVGKLGLSVFADTGKAYAKGEKFNDQPFTTGIGGGVWLTLTAFRMGLSVAHGLGADTRVNFGAGITF